MNEHFPLSNVMERNADNLGAIVLDLEWANMTFDALKTGDSVVPGMVLFSSRKPRKYLSISHHVLYSGKLSSQCLSELQAGAY